MNLTDMLNKISQIAEKGILYDSVLLKDRTTPFISETPKPQCLAQFLSHIAGGSPVMFIDRVSKVRPLLLKVPSE